MFEKRKILTLIPARGGSKGLPGKNIKSLGGKPLIAWTIEEAKKSRYLDKIIISTDHDETAQIARAYGAQVPFMRPKELATDEAKGMDVVLHALDQMKSKEGPWDLVMLLQPTSPLRLAQDMDGAVEFLDQKKAQAVISVCRSEHPPFWANTLPPDRCMKDFLGLEIKNKNRQELGDYYRLNGAIYLGSCDYVRAHQGFFGEETFAYVMPPERSVDIDTELDFQFAEFLMKDFKKR